MSDARKDTGMSALLETIDRKRSGLAKLLRSQDATDFESATACVETDDSDSSAADMLTPSPNEVLFYVAVAENDCPDGRGTLGIRSSGLERVGRTCP